MLTRGFFASVACFFSSQPCFESNIALRTKACITKKKFSFWANRFQSESLVHVVVVEWLEVPEAPGMV